MRKNITVSISDQVYCDVRLWCAKRGVSVSRVVRVFLKDLPRLEEVGRFPLPEAPDPRSLAALFESLDPEEVLDRDEILGIYQLNPDLFDDPTSSACELEGL
jgi:hypothetical protein